MEHQNATFSVADYVVFGLMLVCSAAIGLYYRFSGGKQKTTREYFFANKQMSVLPVSFSLMASVLSAVTLLGVPAEVYMNGTQFFVIIIGSVIATPIIAYAFIPVFLQGEIKSVFEYLSLRFGKQIRVLACVGFMIQVILYSSIVLYAPALALSATTGLPKWASVWSICIICTFYSTIGGMKAVLWTDVFQSLFMFSALSAVIIKGTIDVGGISSVWEMATEGGRMEFGNFDPDPTVRHTVWTLAVGGVFTYIAMSGINQTQVQRLMTLKNLKDAQLSVFISCILANLMVAATVLTGVVLYANFHNCDPLSRSEGTNVNYPDQLLPFFVMESMGAIPGLPGLFVAGVFSGALTTISSVINSLSAMTLVDILQPFVLKESSESRTTLITKSMAFLYGLLCLALTYLADQMGGVLQASLTINNIFGGSLIGLISLGILNPRANQKGALAGFLIALAFCSWIGFGTLYAGVKTPPLKLSVSGCSSNNTSTLYPEVFEVDNITVVLKNVTLCVNQTVEAIGNVNQPKKVFALYRISYMWYAAMGWFLALLVGTIVSFATGGKDDVDPGLLCPLIRKRRLRFEAVKMDEYT